MMAIWPIFVYFLLALAVVVGMIGVSYLLGQRHNEHATGSPYEAGIVPEGTAQIRFSAKFYLMAMFFVIFDLEAVFIYAWAISAIALGWSGYIEIMVFIVILAATLVYLWRLGGLDWAPKPRRPRP
jgi:NADH-quinone oxidoreductase subunit A